jgi:hypothetical protein
MAVTNLLDRLAEDYQGNHPVEYRAPLAKLGKTIGKIDYSLGGGAKGVSARDIIRKDIKGNGVGVYPFDVLERQRNNKRKDDSMPWDYAIQSKDGGMLIDSFNGGTKADANEYMAQLKAKGIVPKDAKLVSNVSSSRQTAQQKRDLDEFKKAFEDVRAQRDHYFNDGHEKGDFLNYPIKSAERKIGFKADDVLNTSEKRAKNYYRVSSWQDWLDAKRAAKDAGQKLGRMFAEQNQREKNMYGNISKGMKPSTDAVPEGRYKYALGNQNHVYSDSPDEPQNDWMNLNPEYHGYPALTNSGHEIHWRKDGTPIIDAYTWTQIPNIENIKKTGYLAVEGSDTENFHPGTKGQWTAEVDNYPMDENYDNHVEIFKRGKNGETFNEELLHSRLPLNWFQKQPITHQGPRGWNVKVDVIHAKPGSPEVFWGEGKNRRSAQVATPAQFINHIPEDKMRKDWAPVWKKNMLPGSHPNKEDLGGTEEFIFGMTGRDPSGTSVEEQKKAASMMANKDSYALQYALRNVDKSDKTELQRNADNAFLEDYVSRTSGNRTPYDLAWQTKNVPQQGEGMIDRGNNTSLSQWNGIELPRTNAFTFQTYLDSKKLSDFLPLDSYERLLNNFYLNKFAGKYGHPANSLSMLRNLIPSPKKAEVLYKDYLDKIGMKNFSEIKKERDSFPGRSFFESPVTSETLNHAPRRGFYKEELKDLKQNRSYDAARKGSFDDWNFVYKNVASNNKFNKLQNFSFDDWFDNYMRNDNFYKDYFQEGVINQPSVQQAIAEEKERVRSYVEKYLENMKNLPTDKQLEKKAYERTKKKFDHGLTREEELEFLKRRQPYQMKADSLDKVIGHTIGRRIGADRAKRGKKIF